MLRSLYICLLLSFVTQTAVGQIVINELCSSNENGIEDASGKTSDWLEIRNKKNFPVALGSLSLSNYEGYLPMWTFPEITLPPHGYLRVFCTGESSLNPTELHTNFKLPQSGGEVFLSTSSGVVISSVDYGYIPTDQSFATYNYHPSDYLICSEPTPGSDNELSTGLFYSHVSGYYDTAFELKIYDPNPESSVHFTRNGRVPSIEETLYTEPIEMTDVSEHSWNISNIPTTPLEGAPNFVPWMWKEPQYVYVSNVFRAAAFQGDSLTSNVISLVYFIDPEMKSRYKYPVASIITDSLNLFSQDSGIYVPGDIYGTIPFTYYPIGNFSQDGSNWEREMYLTFFEPDGKQVFETDAGMQIRGFGSAGFSQKSLNIYFRKKYGLNKVESRLFDNSTMDEFKRLVFRNGGNDFPEGHFKDSYLTQVIKGLNVEIQETEPIVVFINGEYWGLHNMRQKIDKYHFKYKYDLPEDDINVLSVCGSLEDGTNTGYFELIDYIQTHDLDTDGAYAYVSEKLDIESTIDYNIAEIYFANYDWPCNNYKMWNTNEPGSKWKYIIFDLDYTLGFNEFCTYKIKSLEHAVSTEDGWPHCDCSNLIFRNLLKNEEFVNQFLDRFKYCLENVFNPDRMNQIMDEFVAKYEDEMPEHIARLGFPASMGEWEDNIAFFREFINKRPCYMRADIIDFFDLDSFDYTCPRLPREAVTAEDTYYTIDVSDLEKEENETGWQILSNPNDGRFILQNNSGMDLYQGDIQIYNSIGEVIFSRSKVRIEDHSSFQIILNDASAGIYILRIRDKNQDLREKILIQSAR